MFCNCKLQEVEDESDVADGGLAAAGKAACATRDDVLSVLSALLSMHLVQQQVCSRHTQLRSLHLDSHFQHTKRQCLSKLSHFDFT